MLRWTDKMTPTSLVQRFRCVYYIYVQTQALTWQRLCSACVVAIATMMLRWAVGGSPIRPSRIVAQSGFSFSFFFCMLLAGLLHRHARASGKQQKGISDVLSPPSPPFFRYSFSAFMFSLRLSGVLTARSLSGLAVSLGRSVCIGSMPPSTMLFIWLFSIDAWTG